MDTIPILDLKAQYQSLQPEIDRAIAEVLASGQFILGPEVHAFEAEVAAYLGVRHAVAVNSGTDALVIALRSLGIGSGDEVITTPFSFFATAESISLVGARPVFVDVNLRSFNLNPANITAAITPRTKAIMPVHLFGRPAAMGEIHELAQTYKLAIIEDCAQSFGARYCPPATSASVLNQPRHCWPIV
nr:DegT/DnrJ/EryC1/StrS family aminotransferase [Thermostichus lividus]